MEPRASSAAPARERRRSLVVATLGVGGTERVVAMLAKLWAENGATVEVWSYDPPGTRPFYPLDPRIAVHCLGLSRESATLLHSIINTVRRLVRLRRQLRRTAGIVIAFGSEINVTVLLAGIGLGRRIVVAERSDPAIVPFSRVARIFRTLLYRRAAALVVQHEAQAAFFSALDNVRVIPNPVAPPSAGVLPSPVPRPYAVAMGRFSAEKNFGLLIDAFASAARRHPNWRLAIVGDGPMRPALEARARTLGLDGRIVFPGIVCDPERYLDGAELFVLPSRFEGFPNALCEAMAHGVPAVATECSGALRAILRDGVDGLLVPPGDASALADAIERLMDDPTLRKTLGNRATEVCERFSLARVANLWEEVLVPVRR